jgi:carboxymethylenebutenolidase
MSARGVGDPDDVAAKVRAEGGVPDAQVVGDTDAAVQWVRAQPEHNGKVGLFGSCSGGRHAFLYATQRKDVDACAELWGGRVVMSKEELNDKTPLAPIDLTKDLSCPLIGIFGNDDRAPSPEQVNQHEAELMKHGKSYEFHRYDGAGHGFFYWHRPLYRPEQAMDGWSKVLSFFGKHLAK